ncbi:hypothetical protein [Tepidibacter sp. Z1-5]|uniref:hypothetical protein n=1 Tax=Tepidibacter sp. Z1-5 TaxID=3134138 RepID=UPI0030BE8A0B
MKDRSNINSVTIEYKEDEDAKEKFIKFILDYFLEDDLSRKVDSDERFSKRN